MSVTVKTENSLGEKIFINTLSSGAKCYIIPKYGFSAKQAVVSFNYGSGDINFQNIGKNYVSPIGTAHFMEHKMFQKKDKDYFAEFIKNGVNANAFTDASKTAYYFSGKEGFYKNLENLLKMVGEKYFEEESINREKGIIAQEIAMYNDDPNWVVYFNLLSKIYKENPIKYGIAGTKESIEQIDKTVLEAAFDAFYTPQNMNVVVCGDVDCSKVFEIVEKCTQKTETTLKRMNPYELNKIGKNYIKQNMDLAMPVFNIGFKHSAEEVSVKDVYGYKFLLDIIGGESSAAYEKALDRGLLQDGMGLQYLWGQGTSLSIIMGKSKDPKQLGNGILREIERLRESGIDDDTFKRIKKKHMGRFIRGFNSIDAICMAQTELCSLDADLFDGYNAIKYMEKDCVEGLLRTFSNEKAALSVVE